MTAVDDTCFPSVETLADQQRRLDDRGLRATGSPEHADYITDLTRRLIDAGVADVFTDALPMRRWTPLSCGLSVDGAEVAVSSYVAYSGNTGASGVEGRLSRTPAPGVIGVVDIPVSDLPAASFDTLDWDAPNLPEHPVGYNPDELYARVAFSQDLMRAALAEWQDAGAAGLVLVVDLPAHHIVNGYLLYDGVFRDIPAVFVSREQAAMLNDAAERAAKGTLVLDAVVEQVDTHNILGIIPGASDELVVLHSHTDGPNGIEDNGPEAIVAMASYLTKLPSRELGRSVLVLLTTGHFAIEEAWGVEAFLTAHADDLVPRIAAVLSLEHLGALPGRLDSERGNSYSPYEFGCAFATPHRPVIDTVRAALSAAEVTESRLLRPFVPDLTGRSPDGTTWPGDGCPFWHTAGLPTANFITGPDYLFNVEPVMDFIDVSAMRRQVIAFTEATLALGVVPWADLHARIDLALAP